MRTTILAYVIAFLIGTGAWTLFDLFGERDRSPVPQRYYAMAIAMICIGFAMGGIAQTLRLLRMRALGVLSLPLKYNRQGRRCGCQAQPESSFVNSTAALPNLWRSADHR